jgi:hypothetical protein
VKHEPEMAVIPKDVALQLCIEIRRKNKGKWSFATLQCWGCVRFSRGDPARRCVSSRPDYRGCSLVNAHYDRLAAHEVS